MKNILGISAFYHDSAAALVVNGEIIAAAQEERFSREKHTSKFPKKAVSYCLEEAGLTLDELDAVVFYDKPLLKFERLLQTYYAFSPKGLRSFLKAIPVWINEKLFLKKMIRDGLKEVETFEASKLNLLFPEHHLSHAASAFFPSNLKEAAILTVDGVGEWCTASIGLGKGNNIQFLKEMEFPHSVGLLYSAFTYYLGFTVNSGEYKLMGLAPYGLIEDEETQSFIQKIKSTLIDLKSDGSIWLNPKYFNYATGLRMVHDKKWEALFGLSRRNESDEILQSHCNLALAIQEVTEEIVLAMARHAKEITGSSALCLAGGVALNCVANGKILRAGIFDKVYIQPASGDAGGALGAALAIHHMYYQEDRVLGESYDQMKGAYLGPSFSEKEILSMARRAKAKSHHLPFDEISRKAASLLNEGKVVGWFQGRMEFGPRALGNRSILGDPSNPVMQKHLNLKIKYREGFRPFAPSVLATKAQDYFELDAPSPYMLLVCPVKESRRTPRPDNYEEMNLWERLYSTRSDIQSVTHLDYSARVQTVSPETNQRYHQLISDFEKLSGVGLVVNTSFNVRGEPVVCTPFDAYRCFMATEMDALVIENFLFLKEEQEDHENREKWQVSFKPD